MHRSLLFLLNVTLLVLLAAVVGLVWEWLDRQSPSDTVRVFVHGGMCFAILVPGILIQALIEKLR